MVTLKELEETEKPPVDEWAEEQIQLCFSKIMEYQKKGKLPEMLDPTWTPLTMFMQMGMYEPIGIWRINVALEKYNQESSMFSVFVETTSTGELVLTLSSKSESPEEKEMSFWTKAKVACIQFARRKLK